VLGFSVGGGRGSGVSTEKDCLLEGDLIPPFGCVETGKKVCGKV
jgi:hypothetical protein